MSDKDFTQALKPIQDLLDQKKAAATQNPNYRRLGPGYEACCQEWALRDYWKLDEAANLLCGTDSNRPLNIDGPEHQDLNQQVQDMRTLITRADIPKQGTLSKQYAAKEVIMWAKKKSLEIPPALLAAMGHKPPEDKPVHGNALKNAEKRQQVLGAAIAALVRYPAQCKDRGEKPTGTQIAKVLEQQQTTLFPDGTAPLGIRTMADLINEYLPK
ncbi:MAG: hypothetical protein ACOY5W_10490 [Pseudomonadota bacterium]